MFRHLARIREERQRTAAEAVTVAASAGVALAAPPASPAAAAPKSAQVKAERPWSASVAKLSPAPRGDRLQFLESEDPDLCPPVDAFPVEDDLTAFEAETPSQGLTIDEQSAAILAQYRQSRMEFGLARMRMGSYLHLVRENKLWEGISESWESFLASENINAHAARQYINVAKTFIFEMDLPEETLGRLAVAGITALERASREINEENRDEMVSILTGLSERDAIQRILELSSGESGITDRPQLKVLRLLKEYYLMPPDMQIDFLDKIGGKRRRDREAPPPEKPALSGS